jgi:hypothetical protein
LPPIAIIRSIAVRSAGGCLRIDRDVMLQALYRAQHLWQRGDFHERANSKLACWMESLRWILASQTMENSHLRRDNELICVRDSWTIDHSFSRENLNALGIDIARRNCFYRRSCTPALRVNEKLRAGMSELAGD